MVFHLSRQRGEDFEDCLDALARVERTCPPNLIEREFLI